MDLDAKFKLEVSDLNLDMDKLKSLCTQETCVNGKDSITIKSHYDPRAALTIKKWGVELKLPYGTKQDEKYRLALPVVSEIDPAAFNWKESIKTDLIFLKKIAVLKIKDSDIKNISRLAAQRGGIKHCWYGWKDLGDCNCNGDCPKCAGGAAKVSLPDMALSGE